MRPCNQTHRSFDLAVALLLITTITGYAEVPRHFKQLAGPPVEFQAMAPVDPQETAIHSKSALLAVDLQQGGGGQWSWRSEIPVAGETFRFAIISPSSGSDAGTWEVMLQQPGSTRWSSSETFFAKRRQSDFGVSENRFPAMLYEIEQPAPGDWHIAIKGRAPGRGFVLVEGDGPARLVSHLATFDQRVGQRIDITARIEVPREDDDPPTAVATGKAILRVMTPDGRVLTRPMRDDGLHGDGEAGDGVFAGGFLAHCAGAFNAQVVFGGRDSRGSGFLRTAEHLIPVVEDTMRIPDQIVTGRPLSAHRLDLGLEVVAPDASGHFRTYAEVWGTSPLEPEQLIPVAWIGGMTALRGEVLHLGLDTRWIQIAGVRAPFELRNLRVEEPDHFITLASSERMPLRIQALPGPSPVQKIVIDEEMLMGPRPAEWSDPGAPVLLDHTSSVLGEGHRLLLVHGYCSSNVWGNVADQFSNASVFLDLEQNRLIDDFAALIREWAEQWNSYAIVAHSQGGMAALHLYASEWSGLDNTGPGRKIQSVGTPYQGTNLAGILASIGSFLGFVECGSNSDLTYSGAAPWLAGIPPTFRTAVNYYTTSFEDVWYRYDYCHLLTDLALDDPDDGIVEKAKAQLPDGVNQGHKTGWCHTVGMRDPAQYFDEDRNTDMNANAAIGPPPGDFLLSSPVDRYAFDSETSTVSLTWEHAQDAVSYDVYFESSPDPMLVASTVTSPLIMTVSLGETYFWKVKAVNTYGETWSSSGTWTFSVGPLFEDGFESGSTSAWSAAIP